MPTIVNLSVLIAISMDTLQKTVAPNHNIRHPTTNAKPISKTVGTNVQLEHAKSNASTATRTATMPRIASQNPFALFAIEKDIVSGIVGTKPGKRTPRGAITQQNRHHQSQPHNRSKACLLPVKKRRATQHVTDAGRKGIS